MSRLITTVAAALLIHVSALAAGPEGSRYLEIRPSGKIKDRRIVEASGLAHSHLLADRLWTMNDGGSKPQLFALGSDGTIQGSFFLGHAMNIDWEDLASFEHDGKAWLLVADIGDNNAKRSFCSLYVVEEPSTPYSQQLEADREIRFTYPDGPLDAEAVAVDVENQAVLLLTKRTVPARLYSVPLKPPDQTTILIAERLGEVASIPQPTRLDLDRALAEQNWYWQPTAMDFTDDASMAVILTYRGAYLFERKVRQDWTDALQDPPVPLSLDGIELAEAVAFDRSNQDIFVTVEGRKPMLYRFEHEQ